MLAKCVLQRSYVKRLVNISPTIGTNDHDNFFSKSKAACQSVTTSGMKIGNVQSVVRGTGATIMSRYGKIYFLTFTQRFI